MPFFLQFSKAGAKQLHKNQHSKPHGLAPHIFRARLAARREEQRLGSLLSEFLLASGIPASLVAYSELRLEFLRWIDEFESG